MADFVLMKDSIIHRGKLLPTHLLSAVLLAVLSVVLYPRLNGCVLLELQNKRNPWINLKEDKDIHDSFAKFTAKVTKKVQAFTVFQSRKTSDCTGNKDFETMIVVLTLYI